MKLSIITINYNNRDGLRKTIESVVNQTCRDFEYVVIDGGSTDGSVDVIKEYADRIDYWVSEPDKGIYNAMNKGTRASHGEFCQYLNSGDWLYDNTVIEYVVNNLNDSDITLGKTAHFYSENKVIVGRSVNKTISLIDLWCSGINHQSSFIRRSLLVKLGGYDESLKICADFKFWIQALILDNCTFDTMDKIVVYFDCNGISYQRESLNAKERGVVINSLIPDRIIEDYNSLTRQSFYLSKELKKYDGFAKLLIRINLAILSTYSFITQKIKW